MHGEMIGDKGYSFGQEKDWMGRLEEYLKEVDIRSERWREAAQKAAQQQWR